jgi:hypothetical protein
VRWRRRAKWLAVVAGAYALAEGLVVVGCSSDSPPMLGDSTPPPGNVRDGAPSPVAEGGSGDGASKDAPSGGDAVAQTDGSATDAATKGGDGSPADGGAADAAQVVVDAGASDAAPLCDPTHTWALTHRIPSVPAGTDFARFGGISVDELTMAWTTSTGVIYTADRQTRTTDFDPPVMIPMPATIDSNTAQAAVDRVGLGPSGLTLVAIADVGDGGVGTQVIGFERTRGVDDAGSLSTWVLSPTVEFDAVNAMASSEQSGQLSEPVVSGDGDSLFYVLTTTGGPTLFESKWDDTSHAWAAGSPALPASGLPGPMPLMRATGASSDGRTLFYYDVGAGKERGAWRDTPASAFNQLVDEVAIPEAVPNLRCTTIYFQSIDTNGAGAFVAQ